MDEYNDYEFTPDELAIIKRAESAQGDAAGTGSLWGSLLGGAVGGIAGGIAGNVPGALAGASSGAGIGGGIGNMLGSWVGGNQAKSYQEQAAAIMAKKQEGMKEQERKQKAYQLLAPWLRVPGL